MVNRPFLFSIDGGGGADSVMQTDFGRMELILKAKKLIVDRLSVLECGNVVVEALLRLDSRNLDDVAALKDYAVGHRTLDAEEKRWAAGLSISEAAEKANELKSQARSALKHATASGLSGVDAPLSAAIELANLMKEQQALNQDIKNVPRGTEIRALIRGRHDVERIVAGARWVQDVRCAELPERIADLLLRTDGGNQQSEITPLSARAADATRDLATAANAAASEFNVVFDVADNTGLAERLARLTARQNELPYQLSMAANRRDLLNAGLGSFVAAIEKSSIPPSSYPDVFDRIVTNKRADRVRKTMWSVAEASYGGKWVMTG